MYDDLHMGIWWHWYIARIISSQKIYGLYGPKHHIVEISGDVTDAGRTREGELLSQCNAMDAGSWVSQLLKCWSRLTGCMTPYPFHSDSLDPALPSVPPSHVSKGGAAKQEGSKMYQIHFHIVTSGLSEAPCVPALTTQPAAQSWLWSSELWYVVVRVLWSGTFAFVIKVRKDNEINWTWSGKSWAQWGWQLVIFNCSSSLLSSPPSSGQALGWRTSTRPPSCSPSTATPRPAATPSTRRRSLMRGLRECEGCSGSLKPSKGKRRRTSRAPSSMMPRRSLCTTNTPMTGINLRTTGNQW